MHSIKTIASVIIAVFISAPIFAQTLAEKYTAKAEKYMIKDESIKDYFLIDTGGVAVFKSPDAKKNGEELVRIYWNELDAFKSYCRSLEKDKLVDLMREKGAERFANSPPPMAGDDWRKPGPALPVLQGLRVAIDPGHLGGTMEFAQMERKYVKLRKGAVPGYPAEIQFNEGNLTVATAIMLQEKLEASGAKVLLTRDTIAESAFGMGFDAWKDSLFRPTLKKVAAENGWNQEKIEWWANEATDEQIFHGIFKNEDLKERSRLINSFDPHITLFLHYNIEESNEADNDKYLTPQKSNYSMAFVPGSFMKNELDSLDEQVDFLRILLVEDLDGSVDFSATVLDKIIRHLQVPPVANDADLKYIQNASMATTEAGIFARNLSLTRLVQGKMCFAEPLLQDNEKEAIRLNSIDLRLPGMRTSLRCKQTAEAYFQGILAWAEKQ